MKTIKIPSIQARKIKTLMGRVVDYTIKHGNDSQKKRALEAYRKFSFWYYCSMKEKKS